MPTMTQELDEIRNVIRHKFISADDLAFMDAEGERLRGSGMKDRALQVGQTAPDFSLPDTDGQPMNLYDVLKSGSAIVTFYRGGWCPYCNVALRHLQAALPQFQKAGATLVAISPQLPDGSLSTKQKGELTFPVLSDVGNVAAKSFGLVYTLPPRLLELYRSFNHPLDKMNGDAGRSELPVPATFVIGSNRKVRFAFFDPEYSYRALPSDLLASLKQ